MLPRCSGELPDHRRPRPAQPRRFRNRWSPSVTDCQPACVPRSAVPVTGGMGDLRLPGPGPRGQLWGQPSRRLVDGLPNIKRLSGEVDSPRPTTCGGNTGVLSNTSRSGGWGWTPWNRGFLGTVVMLAATLTDASSAMSDGSQGSQRAFLPQLRLLAPSDVDRQAQRCDGRFDHGGRGRASPASCVASHDAFGAQPVQLGEMTGFARFLECLGGGWLAHRRREGGGVVAGDRDRSRGA